MFVNSPFRNYKYIITRRDEVVNAEFRKNRVFVWKILRHKKWHPKPARRKTVTGGKMKADETAVGGKLGAYEKRQMENRKWM